jgi:hypothetical protein
MRYKILSLVIIISTFSFAQPNEFKEFLLFKFDSSKEQIKKLWSESFLSKYGDLLNPNEDSLKKRIDDFKYFNGWQFFFIDDSLCKISAYFKVASKDCQETINWFRSNFGEPNNSGGDIYYWKYINKIDSSINKISLSCSCFFCEPIPDSARLVISVKNIKPYSQRSDFKSNISFMNGINNCKPGSSLEMINQQIGQVAEMELIPDTDSNSYIESTLSCKNGYVAGLKVDEWHFTFYKSMLYQIVIIFEGRSIYKNDFFNSVLEFVNASYGDNQLLFQSNYDRYDWNFLRINDEDTFLGTIMLEQNKNQNDEIEVTLSLKYSILLFRDI